MSILCISRSELSIALDAGWRFRIRGSSTCGTAIRPDSRYSIEQLPYATLVFPNRFSIGAVGRSLWAGFRKPEEEEKRRTKASGSPTS
jgi:hypothetical protein